MMIRTTFYIDGFNFYNGLKASMQKDASWKKYYWIDLVKFAQGFLSDKHELVAVKYFTAKPLDSGKEKRQSALFKANVLLNGAKFDIIKGKYYKKKIRCNSKCKKKFTIHEEKRTDVNISVQIMGDCILNKTDLIVLISADSDLVPTLEFVSQHFLDKRIKVYFPPCRQSADLFNIMNKSVVFLDSNRGKFEKAIMPDNVITTVGKVSIPPEWIIPAIPPTAGP